MVFLLPHLEQENLYRQLDLPTTRVEDPGPGYPENHFALWGGYPNVANYTAAQKQLTVLQCPSFPNTPGKYTVLGMLNFFVPPRYIYTGLWTEDYREVEKFRPLAHSNYLGVAGDARGMTYEGIYTNRSKTKLVGVSDGTSNTLAFGECSGTRWPSPGEGEPFGYTHNWLGSGAMFAVKGLGYGEEAAVRQFSSYHSGLVQFAFADGSVKAIRIGETAVPGTTDYAVFIQLSGARDGGVLDPSSLLP
jgi:prepilin-type processing-associated H-X9-DG protein